jgi:peptidyl-prolyl cis-trans isomerase C
VILREESRALTPPPFDSVKEQIRPMLQRQKAQTMIENLRKNAKVEVLLPPAPPKLEEAQPAAPADQAAPAPAAEATPAEPASAAPNADVKPVEPATTAK